MSDKTSWTEAELRAAHKASSLPVDQIRKSAQVGCFYCLKVYPSAEVIEHVDYAWCPHCAVDSILPEMEVPEIRNPEFMRAMHAFWF